MSDFIFRMGAIDTNAFAIVILICGWGFLIMRSMLHMPGVALLSFPLMVLNALAARVLFEETYYIGSLDHGAALALTTGIGMSSAAVIVALLVRIALLIGDVAGRRPELLVRAERAALPPQQSR